MSKLEQLGNAENLADLAHLLGYTLTGLSYVIYRLPENRKYHTFEIPKKSGGTRIISAPTSQLALLQRRLTDLLDDCVVQLRRKNSKFWRASHGFRKSRTIVSNAEKHRRSRFVFNADIEDFFGTINFGRVRGFFIKDKSFSYTPVLQP
ncbi:MAG: reverse transcriptase domain-containing protein [Parvibaculaceae bacterium]|nr:reverse transcriptase domain-containing protein [Parvibaculaceae bacterium]